MVERMATRVRLDSWLVEQGHFESRQQALRAVQAGDVRLDGQVADKPGMPINGSPVVEIRSRPPYVSRGGEKLAGALEQFEIALTDRIAIDSGISTGGFSDCLLQRGVARIYGIDVGYGQLAWALRQDPRVSLKERTNLRHLTPLDLYGQGSDPQEWADLATLDLSFISLTKILPALWPLMRSPRECLLLVKPQFEAGRAQVGKKGVVRDPLVQAEAVMRVWQTAAELGWRFRGLTYSPTPGPAGNIEYWLWIDETEGSLGLELKTCLEMARHAQAVLHP
jgi:23S rRNA (cytidine1920-2'-O)/16S rRNA (cytidine1409-2'-O)-methyltransferase